MFAWITFILILVITFIFYFSLKKDSLDNAENYFKFRVDELTALIKQRMDAYEQVLLGGVALFASSEEVTRDDWKNYISKIDIQKSHPGILGIGFSQAIRPGELKEHINNVRSEGFPDYKVWPDYPRSFYTSIVYLEPFEGRNLRAFGYDMFTEETRRVAMSAARDSGITSVSGKVILVQETSTDVQTGFLMYLPVYNNVMPAVTVPQKREAIKGLVFGPFRIRDLVEGIFGEKITDISLNIYDETDTTASGLMFSSVGDIELSPRFQSSLPLYIKNHLWTLKFSTLPSFDNRIDKQKPLIVLVTGIIISILFFIVVVSLVRTNEIRMDLELLLESSGEGVYGVDCEGRCTFINKSALKMLDLNPDQCKGRILHDLIHHHYPDGRNYPVEECPIYISLANGTSYKSEYEFFFRMDGTMFQVSYSFNPIIQYNGVTGGVVTFSDITEKMNIQKALKSSEEKFRVAVDNFPYSFIIYDNERRITFINSIGRRSFYNPEKFVIGKKDEQVLPSELTSTYLPTLISAMETKSGRTTECTINLFGNEISFIANFIPLLNDYGEIDQVLGIIQDITELKKAQQNIINSLKEKDVLLKEIHHRVKNNLQIISSLLNLQTNKIKDEQVVDILKESQNRVRSMALIHERLYQTSDMTQIDFSEYLPELVNHLVSSYHNEQNPVGADLQIAKTKFHIDRSISLALIINELVSNSMKHAFKGTNTNGSNMIQISLVEKERYELIYRDNGKGFPEGINFRMTDSLGLQLVTSLVEQIDGDIDLKRHGGTTFKITFPI